MSTGLLSFYNTIGQVVTLLWGSNIPATVFFEALMPRYNASAHIMLQLLEGVIAVCGVSLGTAYLGDTLNPQIDSLTMWSVSTMLATYFARNALAKLRRVVTAIATAVTPWSE
jgi:hypothetical protein